MRSALGAAAAVCLMDYHTLARWSFVAYWATILCLVAVLIPHIGSTHGWGARRWIDLGLFQFQPSEFAKLAFILAAANFLSRPPDELKQPVNFWKAIGLMMLPFGLILKEPDLGSALVLLPTGLVMMFVAGTPLKYLLRLAAWSEFWARCFSPTFCSRRRPLADSRCRITSASGCWFILARTFCGGQCDAGGKSRTPADCNLKNPIKVRQALISVGSGGLLGKGWRKGDQTALGFLPRGAAHNDFIFSVIAEEEGFAGSILVLALYAVVLFTGLRIAGQARDRLGKLVAVGVVTLLFSHVFINIGMNIRIVPVTGIPLPLLSYGGSSVSCSLIALGLMQNVHIHRRGY